MEGPVQALNQERDGDRCSNAEFEKKDVDRGMAEMESVPDGVGASLEGHPEGGGTTPPL